MQFEDILRKRPIGILATVSDDGPRTRAFQVLWTEGNKLFFSTGAQKPVGQQLVNHPKASFCLENKFSPVLSFNGDVAFVDGMEAKKRAISLLPKQVQDLYDGNPAHESFRVFYIEVKEIRTFSYKEGLKEYTL